MNKAIQVFLRGGLGNQLFQYSTGRWLSLKQQRDLILRTDLLPASEDTIGGVSRWPCQINDFNHIGIVYGARCQPKGRTNTQGKWYQILRELGDRFPVLMLNGGCICGEALPGLDQIKGKTIRMLNSYSSYKSLAFAQRDALAEETSRIVNPSSNYLRLLDLMRGRKTAVLHLRLGDYSGLQATFGSLNVDYLAKSLEITRDQIGDHQLWLMTDTPQSAMASIVNSFQIDRIIGPEELERPMENLSLMSNSDSLIASNSTFSWWAGLLGRRNKLVIAPRMVNAKVNNFDYYDNQILGWNLIDVSASISDA